jgi:D-hexose-6-phosphate mutarotase
MPPPAVLPPSIPGVAAFEKTADGLTRLRITTALSAAEITLDGAHVTHFQPVGTAPVLFLSESSFFAPGKPIRGGVPVCFPWFSARAGRPDAPAHGFARIMRWEVETLEGSAERGASVVLRLASNDQTRPHWPHDFIARLRVEVTRELAITFTVENTGSTPFQFEEALHTYFAVTDVRAVSVTGLEGATYLDKTDGFQRKQLGVDPLHFTAETDRVFPHTAAACVIEDPSAHRRIVIDKTGSQTTVVWNPWIAKAAAMPDFGDDEWPRMLCLETANTGDDAITLAPGASHAMTAAIRLA